MVYVPGSGGPAAASVASGSTAAVTAAADVEELVESMMTLSLRYNHPFAREKKHRAFSATLMVCKPVIVLRRYTAHEYRPQASKQASGRDREIPRVREGARERRKRQKRRAGRRPASPCPGTLRGNHRGTLIIDYRCSRAFDFLYRSFRIPIPSYLLPYAPISSSHTLLSPPPIPSYLLLPYPPISSNTLLSPPLIPSYLLLTLSPPCHNQTTTSHRLTNQPRRPSLGARCSSSWRSPSPRARAPPSCCPSSRS